MMPLNHSSIINLKSWKLSTNPYDEIMKNQGEKEQANDVY